MTEIWKDAIGFEGLYQVSNTGRVRSLDRVVRGCHGSVQNIKGSEKSVGPNKHGYAIVMLYKNNIYKNFSVHRLVATHFIKNPYCYKQINPIDGNKLNNNYTNLEWCSSSYNSIHALSIGLKTPQHGQDASSAKLTNEQAIEIYKLAKEGSIRQVDIAKKFNIANSMVSSIKNKKYWKKVTDEYEKKRSETNHCEKN